MLDTSHRFTGLPSDLPALAELMKLPQWVAWKYEHRKGSEKPTKPLLSPRSGFKASHSNPAHWGSYSQAVQLATRRNLPGVGFVLSEDDDYTGIDLDDCLDDDGNIEPWAKEIVDLAETYCEISPSGHGLRLIARGKIDETVKYDPAHVEIYRDHRYLTITGMHYPPSPTEIRPAPKTIELLMDRVKAHRPRHDTPTPAPLPRPAAKQGSDFFSNVNRRALQSLDSWVTSIFPSAKFQPGTGAWRVPSRDLGRDLQEDLSIAPNGIKDWGVHDMGDSRQGGRTAIDIVIEHGGAPNAKDAAFWLCDRMGTTPDAMGWTERSGSDDSYNPDALLPATVEDSEEEDWDDGVQFSVGGDWTHPGGVMEDIADWIVATSRRPNRPLAVAAAITIVGTMCGRIIAGPTMSGTHLYMVCIGDTAIGKDRPMKAIKSILTETGVPQLAQTGKFMSSSAIEGAVAEQPCHVAVTDEIGGALFAKMSHRRASTHESSMANALRELWSSSFDIFDTSRRANESGKSVKSPSFSIYGVSTVDEFYRSLGAGVVENGLLNRFLVVRAANRAAPQDVDPKIMMRVPTSITQALLAIMPPFDPNNNLVTGASCYGPHSQPTDPLVIPWASDAVRAAYLEFENSILDKVDANPEIAPYLGRTAEMTIRLATIYAVSRFGRAAQITMDALEWGKKITTESAQTMIDDVSDRIVENDQQGKYKKVQDAIRKSRGKPVTLSRIKHILRGSISALDLEKNIMPLIRADRNIRCEAGAKGKGERFSWVGKKT